MLFYLAFTAFTAATAEAATQCQPPPDVQVVSFRSLPVNVYTALAKQVGDIFDAKDGFYRGGHQSDFASHPLFIWRSDRNWIIATDRASPTYSIKVYRFAPDPRSEAVGLDGMQAAFPNTLCRTATDLVTGTGLKGR